ncbi:MAG: MBL fold metallo-hydrolase [Acidimicrobiia bacterium]
MRVLFCGVRGSTPAPGPEFVRYGGHTSCVAVARDGEDPTLVLDAGTGLMRLSQELAGRPFRGTILLGHLHWDHTHGIPFFPAGDRAGGSATVLLPAQGNGAGAESVLERAISPPHFPIRPGQLRGDWRFGEIEEGEHRLEGFDVLAREIPHKGGRTFGYRVSDGRASIAYLSDHWPVGVSPGPEGWGDYHEAAMALAEGVDLLIHDAQYTADDFGAKKDFGHSTVDYAVGLAEAAGARTLALFHHDPWRTDDQIDEIMSAVATGVQVLAAAEGSSIDL